MSITEEEKERRRKIHQINHNITLSGFDNDYIDFRLSHKLEVDYIYDKWINGDITFEQLEKKITDYINSF